MIRSGVVGEELSGQGVGLVIARTWFICEVEIESAEKQSPPGLSRVQPFNVLHVSQVLVVSPNDK